MDFKYVFKTMVGMLTEMVSNAWNLDMSVVSKVLLVAYITVAALVSFMYGFLVGLLIEVPISRVKIFVQELIWRIKKARAIKNG